MCVRVGVTMGKEASLYSFQAGWHGPQYTLLPPMYNVYGIPPDERCPAAGLVCFQYGGREETMDPMSWRSPICPPLMAWARQVDDPRTQTSNHLVSMGWNLVVGSRQVPACGHPMHARGSKRISVPLQIPAPARAPTNTRTHRSIAGCRCKL